MASPVAQLVKNLPANASDARDMGLIPESERSPEGGNGNPLQYSCLENPMDREAWHAAVPGVSKELDTTEYTHTQFNRCQCKDMELKKRDKYKLFIA